MADPADPLRRIADLLGRVEIAEIDHAAEILARLGNVRASDAIREASRAIGAIHQILGDPQPPRDAILCHFGPEGGRILGGDGPHFVAIRADHPYALDGVLWHAPEGAAGPWVWQGRLRPVHFDRTFRGLRFDGLWRPATDDDLAMGRMPGA